MYLRNTEACNHNILRTCQWNTIELEFEKFLLFWFIKLLYDGGIIFDCAQSKFHLVILWILCVRDPHVKNLNLGVLT